MLNAINIIAERKISQAMQEGKLDLDHWRNKPLPADDNDKVPADLRMAYKILKNAGFVPPEIETRKEIQRLEELLATCDDEHIRVKQLKKLDFLILKLNSQRQGVVNLEGHEVYHRKVVEKISIK